MTIRVTCIGGAVLDFIYGVDRLPAVDTKTLAKSYAESGGGMAANAAATVARLGGRATWYGRVGDDDMGRLIVQGLECSGVIAHARVIPGSRSPHSIVFVDAAGDRGIVLYRPEHFSDDAAWLPLDRLCQADAVLGDSRWSTGAARALGAARQRGIPAVLDGDISDDPAFLSAVQACSHAVFSEQGLAGLFRSADPVEGLRLAARHAAFVAVTLGAKGVVWLDHRGAAQRLPAVPAVPRETLAAGDVFHGAFALALGEGQTMLDAMRFAAAAAALKCERVGGRSTFPARAEVHAAMARAPA